MCIATLAVRPKTAMKLKKLSKKQRRQLLDQVAIALIAAMLNNRQGESDHDTVMWAYGDAAKAIKMREKALSRRLAK